MSDVRRFSDAEINRLVKFYEQVEREILDRINRALLRGNQTEYLAAMKKNVEAILQQLREGNRTWVEQAIPRVYTEGLKNADAMLKDAGVSIIAGFGAIHQQAAQVLAENAYQRFEDVVQVIGRQVNDIYRELALENVRGAVVGYDTWKQTARRFREQLAERGVTGFKDRSGRMWNMRTYCEMHARTVCMEAHLQGTANRLVEQGHDLIKVSTHRGACELCQPWQGKILSITGKTKGYPTLEEAKEAGLFHPNCYSKDTEVYTDKGWRLFSELSGDEKILSLNPETHCLEWVSYRGVISYRYSGNMMRFKSNSLDLLVTPDHNMYVGMNTHIGDKKVIHYRLIPAEQLKDRNFKIPRTARWEGGSSVRKFMGVPIEQFAKLLGYYLSEGHAEYDPKNRRYRVSICQHDKRNMEIMRNDLKSLGFYECHNRLILSGKEFASYFLQLGKAHEKHIPDWFMEQPPEILRLFLDAYRLGDGSTRTVERQERNLRSVERKYFTSSKRLADQIGECILKVGNYPYFYLQKVSGKRCSFRNGDYIINHDVWVIAENTSPHSVHNASPSCRHRGIQITDEPYNDMVYCVELEKNHVLWVRRNGRTAWCGNCRHAYGLYIDLDKEIEELEAEDIFTPAKTISEAEAYATDILGLKVNYKGMDLGTANRLNEGMFKTLKEFPQLKGFIDEFKISEAKTFYGQFSPEMIRLAPDQVKIKRTLKFSNMGHKENIHEKLLASIEKDVKENFHFKGVTLQHIAAHELAHALEHQIVFNRLNKDVLSMSEWNNFARTLNLSKEAKSITDAALKNMGINPVGREAYEAYKDLGKYALKNRSELMAQAVADALISDEPLPFSRAVLEEVKKRLGGSQ